MPNTNPSSINRASNPDWHPTEGDTSGAAKIRAERIDAAVAASTNAGDFDAREAAKAALKRNQH